MCGSSCQIKIMKMCCQYRTEKNVHNTINSQVILFFFRSLLVVQTSVHESDVLCKKSDVLYPYPGMRTARTELI